MSQVPIKIPNYNVAAQHYVQNAKIMYTKVIHSHFKQFLLDDCLFIHVHVHAVCVNGFISLYKLEVHVQLQRHDLLKLVFHKNG